MFCQRGVAGELERPTQEMLVGQERALRHNAETRKIEHIGHHSCLWTILSQGFSLYVPEIFIKNYKLLCVLVLNRAFLILLFWRPPPALSASSSVSATIRSQAVCIYWCTQSGPVSCSLLTEFDWPQQEPMTYTFFQVSDKDTICMLIYRDYLLLHATV